MLCRSVSDNIEHSQCVWMLYDCISGGQPGMMKWGIEPITWKHAGYFGDLCLHAQVTT